MIPYGLNHRIRLPEAFTTPPEGIIYDPVLQLNVSGGVPLVHQPDLMVQYSVTWSTTNRDNKTDSGG
jgi:hypothetical protein